MSELRTQTVDEFHDHADETFQRLRESGDAEVLKRDGEAQAVMLSPKSYRALIAEVEAEREAAEMRIAIAEHAAGKGRPAEEVFAELHAELLKMKAAQTVGVQG